MSIVTTIAPFALALIMLALGASLTIKDFTRVFLHPKEFDELGKIGKQMGFDYVAAGPLVRSSYKAAEFYIERKIRGTT